MKKINLLFAAVSLAFCFGCSDDIKIQPQPQLQPLPPAPAPVNLQTQADANFTVASEVNTKLRAVFKWSAAEHNFCLKLAQRLTDQVILEKADLLLSSSGDITIVISPEFELKDRSGNYYRIICNQISVNIVSDGQIRASRTIELKPLPRKLGLEQAKNQYLAPAVKQLIPFLRKELGKLSNEQVAVSIVEFSMKNVSEQPSANRIAQEVKRIARIMAATPGIINYTIVRQDVSKASCSYRVVYMKNRFPHGLKNELNLRLTLK